jgi:nucleoside-diphosphate-sugar epimerase
MVNMLTVQALKNGKITAHCGEHGGNLMRPNTHIEDITNLYCWLLKRPHLMGVWNAGFENLSASATASLIAEVVPAEIELTRVKDKRSYAVDSSRLRKLGFKPKYTVRDAIEEIAASWAAGELKDGDDKMNLAWMQSHGRVRG